MNKQINIFKFVDYRAYLQDYYTCLKKTTKYFSYRYFSLKAGFSSHNVLKHVITGKRNIALKSISKFSAALNLNGRESEYFRLLVLFSQSKNDTEKNSMFTEIIRYRESLSKAKTITDLQYRMYSEWYHAAVRELITLENFKSDPLAASKSFLHPVSVSQIRKSLNLLEEIGLLEKDGDGKWIQKDKTIQTPPEIESLAIREHNRKMMRLGETALDRIDPKDREISGMTLGVSPAMATRIKRMIQDFKEEIFNTVVCDQTDSEEIYQLNFQFFPLLKTNRSDKA